MLFLLALLAGEPPLMAVLELQNRVPEAERGSIDRAYFSDRIRRAALHARPGLRLMTRENMEVLAKAAGLDLSSCDQQCEIETGRKLGADLLVSGDIARVGAAYKLSLRMHDTARANLLSLGLASGATVDLLDKDLDQALAELFAPLGAAPAVAPAPPAAARVPAWRQLWLRHVVQFEGGHTAGSPLGVGPEYSLRAFGVEVHYHLASEDSPGSGSPATPTTTQWSGFAVGLSPLSFGTGAWGESTTFDLTYLEAP